jgi:hypothetical protein
VVPLRSIYENALSNLLDFDENRKFDGSVASNRGARINDYFLAFKACSVREENIPC